MNYIKEINSFYDWLETNRVSKSAIALWQALMHINNKANWTQSFEVAISTLEFKTGFRKSELCEARNILAQKGRIKWKSRGGNLSAVYIIIPFCVHNTYTSLTTSVYANLTQIGTQKGTTNKLNKTKQNKEKIVKENEVNDILISSTGEIKVLSSYLFDTLKILLSDDIYIERLMMNNGFKPADKDKMHDYLKLFFVKLENEGIDYKDDKDAKNHFARWLRIELENKIIKKERRLQYDNSRTETEGYFCGVED